MLKFSVLLLASGCLLACQTSSLVEKKSPPKNIILLIGDGMGPAYVKAYRMYKDDPLTATVETTLFDSIFVGSLRTDPKGFPGEITDSSASAKALATGIKAINGRVTDSAASATAYATGHKAINGSLSVGENNKPLPTVLEKAKQLGKSTGMVVTSQVYHATPAAFVAHELDRDNYAEISNQFFDNQFEGQPYVDILLGGGTKYFVRDDRNIAEEFRMNGYELVTDRDALFDSTGEKLLGLFAESGLKKRMDRRVETPSLAEMTSVAIERLSKNENGFFLMVEGSQIDWSGHDNDIVGVMSEMEDFEKALAEAIKFAKADNDTQIIVTADHSTGGLSVGAAVDGTNHYQWQSEVVRSFKSSPSEMIERAKISGDLLNEFQLAQRASPIELSAKEQSQLKGANLNDFDASQDVITHIINRRSYTGWTTKGHTGLDVNLYAFGPASSELVGNWDNTKLAEFIFGMLAQ